MQSYMYSIFSAVAIVIHLTINFDLLMGRGETGVRGSRYRGFLWGVLFYYVADASWGLFAGLGLLLPWYVDTILFFLSLPVFALAWCRFLVVYLGLGKSAARTLVGIGCALVAASVAALAANFLDGCVFCFDGCGKYHCGWMRDPLFHLLIAYNALMAEFAFMKAIRSDGPARSRNMMVFLHCLTVTIALVLQVVWPLTPFTALGCLIGNCFLHIFVVRDEQSARHAEELERALEQARAADKARSLFFSIVSHDIRTPLNAILGYSELLQRGMESDAERDEALKAIRASGTTLLQLVNDVLDMAKMDAGRMPLHPGPVRIDRLADEVLATFRLAASGKGVELVNRVDAAQAVMLDGHRVRQVLFNLVGNAVKFTARGSVTVAASYDGARLRVSVADTGCGIPREMQSRIFDPFVQVNDPNHSTYKAIGTGLGLSICRRLVGMMGGTISVESEPGRGSTFLVELPGVEAAAGAEPGGAAADAPGAPSLPVAVRSRVLVVDDSPVNRSVLRAFLKNAGVASVDMAEDGEEALSMLDSAAGAGEPYGVVFSDFWMPRVNGLELVERLRADPRFAGLPVFAVSADSEICHDARAGMFTDVLLKPVTFDKLVKALSKAAPQGPQGKNSMKAAEA